jgi:hypothetical protein
MCHLDPRCVNAMVRGPRRYPEDVAGKVLVDSSHEAKITALGDIPLIVLSAGRMELPPGTIYQQRICSRSNKHGKKCRLSSPIFPLRGSRCWHHKAVTIFR